MNHRPYSAMNVLLEYFQNHPNTIISYRRIVRETGIAEGSISGAASKIMSMEPRLKKLSRGMWRWEEPRSVHASKPAAQPAAHSRDTAARSQAAVKLYESIDNLADGSLLLRSEDGQLLKAFPL